MPALKPAPNVLRIVWRYHYAKDLDVVNRFYVRYAGAAPTNAALATFATTVGGLWGSHLAVLAPTEVILFETEVTDLSSDTAAQGVDVTGHTGSNAGGQLAAGTATLINFSVQRRYRGGKPRMYFPFGAQTDLADAQTWITTWPTTVDAAWQQVLLGIFTTPPAGATIAEQVNVSYYSGFTVVTGSTGRAHNVSTPRPTGPLIDVISGSSVSASVASQRRRQRP